MEINVEQVLVDLEDAPLLHPETRQPWTVGLILITAALSAPPQGASYNETEQTSRYMLAMDVRNALRNVEKCVDIPPEMIVKLKADIVRSFGPIVAGQMMPLLNGSPGRPN